MYKQSTEPVGYGAVHSRLRKARGRAGDLPCEFCGKPALDWAFDHQNPRASSAAAKDARGRTFSEDLTLYMPLCRPCHILFDDSQVTHCPAGHPYSGDNVIYRTGWRSNHRNCRTCKSAWRRRYYLQCKEAKLTQKRDAA